MRKLEEARKAEEARRLEDGRRLEEARRAEEVRKAEETRRLEEAQVREEHAVRTLRHCRQVRVVLWWMDWAKVVCQQRKRKAAIKKTEADRVATEERLAKMAAELKEKQDWLDAKAAELKV